MICKNCSATVPDGRYCVQCGATQDTPVRKPKARGNGQGTVFKRGKTWYCQVTAYFYADGGKLHQKRRTKGGFRTKKEALDYIPTLRGPQEKRVPTLLALHEQWRITDYPKLSKSKQSAYSKARERLEPIIGRAIDTLSLADLQEVVNAAPSYYTARDMKSLLSHLYQKALPDGFVPSNLSQYIVLPELQESESKPFTEEEVSAFWTAFAAGDVFVGYILLMIYSGMMPGELLACRKSMVDLKRMEIYGCGKKTEHRKEVPIVFPQFIVPVLEALMEKAGKGEKLLQMQKDNFYSAYYAKLEELNIRRLPPYSCRHTTGTAAARVNLSAPVIQQIMRHKKMQTSQKYIHLSSDDAHRGVEKLAK